MGRRNKICLGVGFLLLLTAVVVGAAVMDAREAAAPTAQVTASSSPASSETEEEDILTGEDVEGLIVLDGEPVLPDWEIFKDNDVFNVLLIGTDERSDTFSDNARSDSMMIASINKSTGEIKLVSLERGMGVPVLEGEYEGQYDWLTHIFRYGGAELLMRTVRTCFRVDVYQYIRANFNSVEQIVDLLGGVDIELTQEEADALSSDTVPLQAGLNHLNGAQALSYSRLRKIDSDWKRVERQRNVLQQILYGTADMQLKDVTAFVNEILPLLKTNLSNSELAALLLTVSESLGTDIEQMTLPEQGTYGSMVGMGGRHLFAVDFEENAKILQEFLYRDVEVASDTGQEEETQPASSLPTEGNSET